MQKTTRATLATVALIASALSVRAQATDTGVEMAFMPTTMTVTLLNEGGKYVTVDVKHIPQGGPVAWTRMRLSRGWARVRALERRAFAMSRRQVSTGGCPFLTAFDLPDADYAAGRAAFVQMKDDSWKKVDEIKKDLGEKWNEVIGKKE